MLKKIQRFLINFISSRTFFLYVMFVVMAVLLFQRIFTLQIVQGEDKQQEFELKIKKERSIASTRGNIYDVNGIALAYNELSSSVTIEDVYESSKKNATINGILKKVLHLLDENGDSIYGCGMSDVKYPDFGRYTQRGNKLYLHLYEKCNRPIRLCGLLDKIESIRLLRDGSEVKLLDPNSFHGPIYREYPGDAFFFMGGRSEELPDPWDTVFEITLKD